MRPTKSPAPLPRRSTPTPPTWPGAAVTIVGHLRSYLGAALIVLIAGLTFALAIVLMRASRVVVGPVQVTRAQ